LEKFFGKHPSSQVHVFTVNSRDLCEELIYFKETASKIGLPRPKLLNILNQVRLIKRFSIAIVDAYDK